MKYTRFEELPVWQAAIRLGVEVYTLTSDEAFKGQRSLRDQLERAAVSVSNNIAEGFERGTTNERTPRFPPHRARLGGRSPFDALLTRKITRLQWLSFEISNLKSSAEGISRQLRAWADSLQNSDIKGQRHLNEKSRRSTQAARDREEFLAELRRAQEVNINRQKQVEALNEAKTDD